MEGKLQGFRSAIWFRVKGSGKIRVLFSGPQNKDDIISGSTLQPSDFWKLFHVILIESLVGTLGIS